MPRGVPSSAGPHGQFGFLNIFMIEPAKFTDPPTYTATPTLLGRCRSRRLRETLTRNAGRHEAMPLMPLRCSSISSGGAESQVCPRRRMRLCSRNFPGTAAASIHQHFGAAFPRDFTAGTVLLYSSCPWATPVKACRSDISSGTQHSSMIWIPSACCLLTM